MAQNVYDGRNVSRCDFDRDPSRKCRRIDRKS